MSDQPRTIEGWQFSTVGAERRSLAPDDAAEGVAYAGSAIGGFQG